jgi:hypothetical protein
MLVWLGMLCLAYLIGVVGKAVWNTSVVSITITYLAHFGATAPKYGVSRVFRLSYSR